MRDYKKRLAATLASSSMLVSPEAWAAEYGEIDNIIVTAPKSERRSLQPQMDISYDKISAKFPTTLTEIFNAELGVGIRTNSRGEAVLRLRGSEERQSQIFIDGAPISVPWDGRADLSLFPSGVVRSARVIKSAAPIEYGAGAVLGVVDISTGYNADNAEYNARAEWGSHNAMLFEGAAYVPLDNGIDIQMGANHIERDAITVADGDVIPFDPNTENGRTNTDINSDSIFVAIGTSQEWGNMRLSIMDISANKGIAAAAHIDPDESGARFWRYPDWNMTQISIASKFNVGEQSELRVNAWNQRFGQSIVSYNDISYSLAEDEQKDSDRTYGGRAVLSKNWELVTTRLVASLQESTHDQVETDLIGNDVGEMEQFRQRVYSVGGEVDIPLGDNVKASISSAYDHSSTPLTGGRPEQPAIGKWAGSAALEWQTSDSLTITSTLGQRTRFPTMRELYSTALGRFMLNPDLKPETALVGDLTFAWQPQDLPVIVNFTPWFSRINDTLSRRNVDIGGDILRQRINLEGSFGYGAELSANWLISDVFTLEADLYLQNLKADKDSQGERATLYQRPDSQMLFAANYTFENNANFRAELNHTGKSFDENEDGSIATLKASTEVNLRVSLPVTINKFDGFQLYAAVDNVTDAVVLPQLGLPAPGRRFKIGLRVGSF